MEFVDLGAQQRRIEEPLRSGIDAVLEHGRYINGPEVADLEAKLGEYVGVPHAVACSSGTDALLAPLMALGVKQGDAVFTSSFTFAATVEVICLLGATPVFVDIDDETYNIDPARLDDAVRDTREAGILTPKGVIAVDLFGQPADYDSIDALASEHGLWVLEDAAQSLGSSYNGRRAGALAQVAATSFFPSKPLGCYGDGGMIFTTSDALANLVRSICSHGSGDEKYHTVRVGLNARLDTLQAAVLLAKLQVFEEEADRRRTVGRRYSQLLQGVCRVPRVADGVDPVFAQYSIRHPRRGELRSELNRLGIPTAVYYPCPLHLQPAYEHLRGSGEFPNSERAAEEILALPMHPYLSEADQDRIVDAIRGAIAGWG